MVTPLDALTDILRRNKQSVSRPRLAVFQVLEQHGAMTISQLIAACDVTIDRASVYRTISLFERLGIVQRLQIGWKYRIELSDSFQQHHHHLHCTACGRTVALPEDDLLEERIAALAQLQDFATQDHLIEIRGLCRSCSDMQDN